MTTVNFPDHAHVKEQAAEWIAIIDRGISEAEQSELDRWLSGNSLHGEVLVQTAAMWDLLDVLSPISKLLPIRQLESLDFSSPARAEFMNVVSEVDSSTVNYRSFISIAASVMLIGIGFFLFRGTFNIGSISSLQSSQFADSIQKVSSNSVLLESVEGREYATSVGEQLTINLSDGSEIKLNTDSRLRVNFTQGERRIALTKGEAYFDVAKSPNRPFVVITEQSRVTAIGTAFSVDISGVVSTEVLVAHGKVKVGRRGTQEGLRDVSAGLKPELAHEAVYLSKGQKALLSHDRLTTINSDNLEDQLAWRSGRIVFTGETLSQVVTEINRYSATEFRVADPAIKSISVGGFFKTGDIDQLINVLEQNFGVRSERYGEIVLLSKSQ